MNTVFRRKSLIIVLLGQCGAGMALAELNDTGVDVCRNHATGADTQINAGTTCSQMPVHGRQDARFGRDAAASQGQLAKIGGGGKGFDFTKIANNGSVLPASATLGSGSTDWACTRDNQTGLMWEVKTASGLRGKAHTYTWLDSVNNYHGQAGVVSGGTCQDVGRCDTEKYVADANATALCGHGDWRLPTVSELVNLIDHGRGNPSIDPTYFPDMPTSGLQYPPALPLPSAASLMYWSSAPYVWYGGHAWAVGFYGGSVVSPPAGTALHVRLVRGGS